jgi:hypothetical protein
VYLWAPGSACHRVCRIPYHPKAPHKDIWFSILQKPSENSPPNLTSKMSSCFGSRKKSKHGDRQPLLPQYEDDTSLQRMAHQKLHTYQMLRALSKGFMPSTEQTIVNLRTLLASDVLNPETPGLSESGRKLVKYSKQWLNEFIELLRNKNDGDQIQDFIWFLIHAKISVDTNDLIRTARSTRTKADASAGIFHALN